MAVALRRTSVLLAFLFVTSINVFAADEPWNGAPFSADPKAMLAAASAVPHGESDVVILLQESRYTFDANGRATTIERTVYRIVEESAIEDWSTAEAHWAPWFEERPAIEARVIAADGSVRKLEPGAVTEAPAPTSLDIFSDNRVIRAPLPNVATGSIVEQVTTHRQKQSVLDAGIGDVFYFGGYVPTHRARLIVEYPASLPLHIANQTAPRVEPVQQSANGMQRVVFDGGPYTPSEHYEWNLPYDVSTIPYVAFSTGRSWQDIARRYSSIVDAQIAAGKPRNDIVGNSTNRIEIISRALAYIQKSVRYAGVEVGESSIVPRTPAFVVSNRYGDCKDKATLLVALLRAAGVNADVALLRAGSDLDVRPDLPGLARFNHAIVLVRGTPAIWIDPTDEYTRAGELPSADQGRNALVANANTVELMQTPVADAAANRTVETRVFTLSEEGRATVVETTTPSGTSEASMRRFAATTDQKSYRESLESYAKSDYVAKALKSYDTSDPHDLKTPFRLRLEVSEAERGYTEDGQAFVAVFPTEIVNELPSALRIKGAKPGDDTAKPRQPRQNDFVFRPFSTEWQYRIMPPPGYAARELPQNETAKLGSATMTMNYATDKDGAIVASFRFDSGKRRLSAAEFEATRKAVLEFLDRPAVMLGFDQIALVKLQAGDVAGALAEYRKLAAMHPKEARHQVEIARAMLSAGLADAARVQAKKAIALEPSYPGAHRALGYIMQHDLLGRPFRNGWDLAAARDAFRKARDLAPKDVTIRSEYAKLLEFGDDGLVFGANSRVNDAVVEYTYLIDELGEGATYSGELIVALAEAGKFNELKARAKRTEDEGQRRRGMLIAIAATDGTAAALREANTYDQAAKKTALKEAAGVLMSLRMYPAAAAMLEAANGPSATPAERAQIDVIKKARRFEEMQLADDDPRTVVKRAVNEMITKPVTGAQVGKFFAGDFQQIFAKGDEGISSVRRIIIRMARKQGMPLAFYADLGISAAQYMQEGSDQTGYRIRLRSAGDVTTETYFVVREGSQYRIAGLTRVPSMIGVTVLKFVDANQLDAARQWLNWTRDEFAGSSGDDDIDGLPFTSLWGKATQAATAQEIRVAAASLLISEETADRAIPMLEGARKTETAERQLHIDHALAMAYREKDRYDAVLPIALRLKAARPKSDEAFQILTTTYHHLGKYNEIRQLAMERLQLMPKDQVALNTLADAAMYSGDYPAADKYLQQIVTELTPTEVEYNQIAWNALLAGRNIDKALENAQQGLGPSGTGSAAFMHTVAAIYAELGKNVEARDLLLKEIDAAGREEPSPSDWYVLGRLAENYGLKDAAIAAYRKVDKPKIKDASACFVLADRRMQALGARW